MNRKVAVPIEVADVAEGAIDGYIIDVDAYTVATGVLLVN